MEKVLVSQKPSQKQGENIFQRTEQQTQKNDFAFVFDQNSIWSKSNGNGFDLTQVPAHPALHTNEQIQCCSKDGSDCSCPKCREASKDNDIGELGEQQESAESQPEQTANEQAVAEHNVNEQPVAEQNPEEASPAPELSETQQNETENSQEQASSTLVIEDNVTDLSEGQMRKTEFLQKLRSSICDTIGPVLATVGQTTEGCPYLNYWLDLYQEKDAAQIERTAKKYAPDVTNATTAEEYISIITQRALRAAEIWARTGKLSGIPEGVPTTLPGESQSENNKEENPVQAKAKNGGVKKTDDPKAIKSELGNGQPLSSDVRSTMESAFGINFSNVRTHTDSTASDLSSKINARAFTVGSHIAFGNGEYQPGTLMGDALIAHELAHTIQQNGAENSVDKLEAGTSDYDSLEKDADTTAIGILSSLWGDKKNEPGGMIQRSIPILRSGLKIQRCGASQTASKTTTPQAAKGSCGQTSAASTYTPTDSGLGAMTLGSDFGDTDRYKAQFGIGACKENSTWKFYLKDLVVKVKSEVQPAGFRTEVPDANDQIVTSGTYRPIIADLRPDRSGDFTVTCNHHSWTDTVNSYSRRRTYWHREFVVDHEAFHRSDWDSMYRPELVKAEQQIWSYVIPTAQAASESAAIQTARPVFNGYMENAYEQACQQYGPHKESRAYDHGAPQYKGLVDTIKSRATNEHW